MVLSFCSVYTLNKINVSYMEDCNMASILVDYENVCSQNGLDGVQFLNSADTLYIFYSASCDRIRADYMEQIKASDCTFRIIKLVKPGKNGLDFYIATEIGKLVSIGEKQIAIISKDKGFSAVVDYIEATSNNDIKILYAPSVEKGLSAFQDPENADRRRAIHDKLTTLDIAAEQARYEEHQRIKAKIESALCGTDYKVELDNIVDFASSQLGKPKKDIYSNTLHEYGIRNGLHIYRLIKKVM